VIGVDPATTGESLPQTLARLRADPAVEFAEPDRLRYAQATPNDPLFTGQWYMNSAAAAAAPSATDAVGAWNTTTGSNGVVIAVLDTGARYDHVDIGRGGSGGKLLPGYDFVTDSIVANDGDGRDADASDPGDWVTSADTATSRFSGCSVSSSSWHGTRVAGIIGARTNNSAGVAGYNWNGWILPVRVLGKCAGTDSDILAALLWAAGIHVDGVPDNPFPAKIINMSLGAVGNCSASYQLTMNQLTALGVLVVVSAGNEGGPVGSPANCPGVAAIAGLRHIGTKVGFSSLGNEIALSAPGGNCVNTGAGQPCLFSIDTTNNTGTTVPVASSYTDQLNFNVGTSFAAPIVSGIAGLMKSVNGNLGSAQLIARLREGATAFPTTSTTVPTPPVCHVPVNGGDIQNSECICTTQTCGAGMANAAAAVNAALRPIAAIAVPVSVSPGQNVVLQGGGSAAACGRSLSSYAWSMVAGISAGPPPAISGANTPTATITGLTSGSVTLRLTVTDDAGRIDTADVMVTTLAATTAAPASAGNTACLPNLNLDANGAVSVSVSPATATIARGATQAFAATVLNTSLLVVTWQVNGIAGGNATVGTINSSGVYTAPAAVLTPATVSVSAVSSAPGAASGSAQVTITSPFAVTVSPTTSSLTAGSGATQNFAATVGGTTSTAVSWQVNGVTGGTATVGTISTTGVYTVPAVVPTPAVVTVTAVAQADATSTASAQVSIAAPAVVTPPASSGGGSSGGGGGGGGVDFGMATLLALLLALKCLPARIRLRSQLVTAAPRRVVACVLLATLSLLSASPSDAAGVSAKQQALNAQALNCRTVAWIGYTQLAPDTFFDSEDRVSVLRQLIAGQFQSRGISVVSNRAEANCLIDLQFEVSRTVGGMGGIDSSDCIGLNCNVRNDGSQNSGTTRNTVVFQEAQLVLYALNKRTRLWNGNYNLYAAGGNGVAVTISGMRMANPDEDIRKVTDVASGLLKSFPAKPAEPSPR
jgi:serine protease